MLRQIPTISGSQRARCLFALLPTIFFAVQTCGAGETKTSLIIEGGGLPPYCPALQRLVEAANVEGRIRIGYIPAAATHPERESKQFVERMAPYHIQPEQIQILDITLENASSQADNPVIVGQIRECTAIFFGGGDQTRITRSLRKSDGSPSAALTAIYDHWKNGGVIAGTSAGAAVQSLAMISVSGFPDDAIDDGMDALDFGLTKASEQPARRGLLVSQGLGFLRCGIIDQHFTQYRGRLGRLARAAIEEKIQYGFGIDEDAALVVASDGTMEVLGPGHVTIVDASGATCQDGPLGCRITGVHLTCLGHGDRFDPTTGKATIHSGKEPVEHGDQRYNGNFHIPDIAARGAVTHALIDGLGQNTRAKQVGVTLKHHRHHGHGYRYTFAKTAQTGIYAGLLNGTEVESVTYVRLDIEPVNLNLRPPEAGLPIDLAEGTTRLMLAAISFRGIMAADDHNRFRPDDPVTRGELASAIAQTLKLSPARGDSPMISDVREDSADADDIALVVISGLMAAEGGAFRPDESMSRQEAAKILVQLAERYRSAVLGKPALKPKDAEMIDPALNDVVLAAGAEGLLKMVEGRIRPTDKMTRGEVAEALFVNFGFPWSEAKSATSSESPSASERASP
ncbi:MAG TPA: cyanophycinase [Planctomycetaceae bacterium]|nr:cyanophycinase [Planctomycetaceae bacterium]